MMTEKRLNEIQNCVFKTILNKPVKESEVKDILSKIMKVVGVEGWGKKKDGDKLTLTKVIRFKKRTTYYFFSIEVTSVDIYFKSYKAFKNGYLGMTRMAEFEFGIPMEGKREEFEIKIANEELQYDRFVLPTPPTNKI
jgi:hypothetical protein